MNDAAPTVNAGNRMCQPITQANWTRERRTGSRSICATSLLCHPTNRHSLIRKPSELARASRHQHRADRAKHPRHDHLAGHPLLGAQRRLDERIAQAPVWFELALFGCDGVCGKLARALGAQFDKAEEDLVPLRLKLGNGARSDLRLETVDQ